MGKWIPDRKYLAGGISGVIAFFIMTLSGMEEALASQLAAAVTAVVAYFVPASVGDIINKIDSTLKKLDNQQKAAVKDQVAAS